MNIQKIKTTAHDVQGFTLVELIVVITILVILGTIAFLNLGGFSATARDSQRTSDLNQIGQQISLMQSKNGVSQIAMIAVASGALASPVIGGSGISVSIGNNYNGGNVNYTVLQIDQNKMQDPTWKVPYKLAATTLAGGAYELAATLEENKVALVMGTYIARGTGATTQASGTVNSSASTITLSSGFGIFELSDWIKQWTTGTGVQIVAISWDLKTLTFSGSNTITSGPAFQLVASDTLGLIAQTGSTSTPVTNKNTYLPY